MMTNTMVVGCRKADVAFVENTSRLDKLRINESHKIYRDFLIGYRRYDPGQCDIRTAQLLPPVRSSLNVHHVLPVPVQVNVN
jgi:hypothetical protein